MPPPTYRITTLGCRVNHAESREIVSLLEGRGLRPAPPEAPAALEVVHTCSVTHTAAAKSRQAARRAARRAGTAPPLVLVTGCYAGTDPAEAADIVGDADRVIGHAPDQTTNTPRSMLERLARRIDAWLDEAELHEEVGTEGHPSPVREDAAASCDTSRVVPLPVVLPEAGQTRHIRAEIRIQDGCDAHCTFCIIPKIRPVLRSKRIDDAIAEATRLVELGHREIVLSGIFIGAYGHETALRRRQAAPDAEPLADLLDAVARVPGLERVRISSMEPGDVTPALLDAMVANAPIVVPHLHLPLQSGSDAILRRMNRQYGVEAYAAMLESVNAALTTDGLGPALTTDIICGFPGETEADFEATLAMARRAGFLHMHVFPYSARHGTAAARWTDRAIPEAVKKARVRRLIELEEQELAPAFRRRLLGRTVRIIVEQPAGDDAVTGRCDHYALIHVRGAHPRGTVLEARVTAVTDDRIDAEPQERRLTLPVLAGDSVH